MSYILEALRKAERERRVSRVPTLDAAHGDPDAPRRRPWPWPWVIAGAVALGAVVAYLAWTPGRPPRVEQAASVVVPKSAAVETRPSPASAPAPSALAPSVDRAAAPAAPAAPPTVVPPSGPPKLVRPRTPAPRATLPPAVPPAVPAEAEPRPAPAAAGSDGSSAGLRPGAVPEVRLAPPTGNPVGSAPSEARPAAVSPTVPPGAAASSEPARPAPGEASARFTLDVLVYSDAPAERLVFINGRKYVEGQAVDGETVVEQITPDGAVLRNAERRIVLSPKLNPYTRPRSP